MFRPNDLGDLLTTTPLFAALRCRFPSTTLIAAIGCWGKPVLQHNPNVDEVVQLDVPWNNKFVRDQSWASVYRYFRRSTQIEDLAARGGFDVGIDVMGSHLGALLMMRIGVRYRVGVRGYRGGWSACQRYIQFSDRTHVAQAALAQSELLGARDLPAARPQLFLTEDERAEAGRVWAQGRPRRPRLLVGCGGGLPEKVWPSAELGEALRRLTASEAGQPDVLIVGGPGDRDRATEVLARAGPRVRSVCGDTSLRTTFALTEQADVVLTNPSILLHAAAAFRRPTVAVLGGMYGDAGKHDVLWGYPPPYTSVSPSNSVSGWPTVDHVVAAVERAIPRD